jgi:hypothetical protein
METIKKEKGQFYTTNADYILSGMSGPPNNIRCVLEPFSGQGDLIDWLKQKDYKGQIECYDIDPKTTNAMRRDTIKYPPDYTDTWILTNPPYLARNKSNNKELYDMYDATDLYKCFINSVVQQNNCKGGIFIIPVSFFLSPMGKNIRCRADFMKRFKITKVNYFEESVFNDTTTSVVAFSFEKSKQELTEQNLNWTFFPSRLERSFHVDETTGWIIGGDIYNLSVPPNVSIRRHVEGKPIENNEQLTFITLKALDDNDESGKINLSYKKDHIYKAKDSSRTYATLCISGKTLSETEQIELCDKFNNFMNKKRQETFSLFLPQFREGSRKRIPFDLAYRVILHLTTQNNL